TSKKIKEIIRESTLGNRIPELQRLKEENESLKRELKIFKEKMIKKPPNASINSQLNSGTAHRSTFGQVAKKLAEGKPDVMSMNTPDDVKKITRHYSLLVRRGGLSQGSCVKYSDVKILLKDLGFKVNRLINLEFIGTKILEVTIPGNYAAKFIKKMKELESFEILPKVDPSKPMDPGTSKDPGTIKEA
ncbi:hypothetical protein BB560_004331, partial [Smittium megazygosporum]